MGLPMALSLEVTVTTDVGGSPPRGLLLYQGSLLICGLPSMGGVQRYGDLSNCKWGATEKFLNKTP